MLAERSCRISKCPMQARCAAGSLIDLALRLAPGAQNGGIVCHHRIRNCVGGSACIAPIAAATSVSHTVIK